MSGGMHKDVMFGENSQPIRAGVTDEEQIFGFDFSGGDHVISYLIYSPHIDVRFETDAAISDNSMLILAGGSYQENLLVREIHLQALNEGEDAYVYIRGIR